MRRWFSKSRAVHTSEGGTDKLGSTGAECACSMAKISICSRTPTGPERGMVARSVVAPLISRCRWGKR